MAGVKITDLGAITEAASDDLLYIVDVSDNTDGPDGSSKKIAVGDIFISGTWTPVFSNEQDACSNATAIKGLYNRIANIVTCTILGTIDLDFTSFNFGSLETTFPISTTTPNAIGTVSISLDKNVNGFKNDNYIIQFASDDSTFLSSTIYFSIVFQYEIN
jgi:hypothetical protein